MYINPLSWYDHLVVDRSKLTASKLKKIHVIFRRFFYQLF